MFSSRVTWQSYKFNNKKCARNVKLFSIAQDTQLLLKLLLELIHFSSSVNVELCFCKSRFAVSNLAIAHTCLLNPCAHTHEESYICYYCTSLCPYLFTEHLCAHMHEESYICYYLNDLVLAKINKIRK